MADIPLKSLTFPGMSNTYINTPVSTAPQFSTVAAYEIGDYVFYNRDLYCFTQAHSAGAWIGTDAEQVTVGSELKSIISTLAALQIAEEASF